MTGSSMRAVLLSVALSVPTVLVAQAPPNATAKCKDGSYITQTEHKGACKGHKGVAQWLTAAAPATPAAAKSAAPAPAPAAMPKSTHTKAAAAAPAPAPAPAPANAMKAAAPTAAAGAAPAGATALCKDGSYSKSKQHSGACSKHGGVKEWLTPKS